MTEEDFIPKIHYEGGVIEALEYGLSYKDLSPRCRLRTHWRLLEQKYKEFKSYVDDIYDEIGEEE